MDHMNIYTKFLTNLINVDVAIEEKDKALILLNSLPDEEYETFVLTLINSKQIHNYRCVGCSCELRSEKEGQAVFFQKNNSRGDDSKRDRSQS